MPWTIPNLLLHDKPVPLSNMRSHGRNRVFLYCSNPGCHHNAELDVSRLPDYVTFNDLQSRRHGYITADWSHPFADPDAAARQHSPASNGGGLDVTLSRPQQRILNSLATWKQIGEAPPSNAQVAWPAGNSPSSSSYANPRSALKTVGLIE
jgi:hypothetical protein